uniref:Uncharacterized protein n=1 Tax=Phlebotomus papatasi TaxID=29031 RepID=A0A1B0D832_PHLPP
PACGKVFPVGVQFDYEVRNLVVINDLHAGEYNSSIEVAGTLKLRKLFESEKKKLFTFALQSPSLKGTDKNFNLPQSEDERFLVEFDGSDANIYLLESDTISLRNFKRGIASLFQFFPEDEPKTETDVTGQCSLAYDVLSDRKFVKRKIRCNTDNEDTYHRRESPLGVMIPNARNTEYHLDVAGSIESIENIEFFRISLAGNKDVGATVDSRTWLKLLSQKDVEGQSTTSSYDDIIKEFKDFQKFKITHEHEEAPYKPEKSETNDLANGNIGTEKLSYATLKLVEAARRAKEEDLVRILNAKTTKEIRGQLMDVLGATQTLAAHNAVKKVLEFSKLADFAYVERYLQSLACGSQPKAEVIEDLLEMLKKDDHENQKLTESLIQSISSMASNFAALDGQSENSQIFREVLKFFTKIIETTSKSQRKIQFLHGLMNLKSAETIPLLMDSVLNGPRAISVEAMKSLVTMPREYFNLDYVKHFEQIYHQKRKRFDSSVRTMAMEILLDPLFYQSSLKNMIYSLKSTDNSYEVRQYFLQRLRMESENSAEFRKFANDIIQEDPTLNNYHVIGAKGLSTALSRKFLTSPSFNSTLLSVQEIDKGILKRGVVDMIFETDKSKFSYFKIGLYADGLSSFMGSSDSESEESSEDQPDPTAGMELVV